MLTTHIRVPGGKIDLFLYADRNLHGTLDLGILLLLLCGLRSGSRGRSIGLQGLKVDDMDRGVFRFQAFEVRHELLAGDEERGVCVECADGKDGGRGLDGRVQGDCDL